MAYRQAIKVSQEPKQAKQEPQETLDQFHARLRTLAQTYEFTNIDFEVEQQIIIAGTSSRIRKRALRDRNYNLAAMLLDGRRDEQSAYQAKNIEAKEQQLEETHKITTPKSLKCRQCEGQYSHEASCPARGEQCRKCGKQNHFASVCCGKAQTSTTKPRKQVQKSCPSPWRKQ